MARTSKQKEKPGEAVKNLHIGVPESFHVRLKMMCVIQKITIKDYALSAIEEKIARDEKRMLSKK